MWFYSSVIWCIRLSIFGSADTEGTCHGEMSLAPLITLGFGSCPADCVCFLVTTVTTLALPLLGTLFTLVVDTLRVTALLLANEVSWKTPKTIIETTSSLWRITFYRYTSNIALLTLEAPKYFGINHGNQRVFSIWYHWKSLSLLLSIHLNTYVMGLRPFEIF